MYIGTAIIIFLIELGALLWLIFYFFSGVFSAISGAPYVPMERYRIHKILAFGEVSSHDVFYDLGSGDGRVLMTAVQEFHVGRAVGYEIAPWPYWKCRWRLHRKGFKNIEIRRQNFLDASIQEATCIYAYLFPKLMERLAVKFAAELKPGTRIICPAFPIDTEKHPQFRLKKSEKIGTLTLYLYEKI